MARPGKFDHLKHEILRRYNEGFSFSDILKAYPGLAKSTLSAWINNLDKHLTGGPDPVPNNLEPVPNQPKEIPEATEKQEIQKARVRLAKVDPDGPLTEVKRHLWDVVNDPTQSGAGVKIQACNALIKAIQWEHGVATAQAESELDLENMTDAELEKIAAGG